MGLSDRDVQKLILENAKLKENHIDHCRGCTNLGRHPCGAFFHCPYLGVVDPDKDGCSKRNITKR